MDTNCYFRGSPSLFRGLSQGKWRPIWLTEHKKAECLTRENDPMLFELGRHPFSGFEIELYDLLLLKLVYEIRNTIILISFLPRNELKKNCGFLGYFPSLRTPEMTLSAPTLIANHLPEILAQHADTTNFEAYLKHERRQKALSLNLYEKYQKNKRLWITPKSL